MKTDSTQARPPARRTVLVGLGTVLSVALLATACSSSKKSTAGGGSTPPSTPTTSAAAPASGGGSSTSGTLVHVQNFAFNPSTVTVSVGSAVTWEFDDSISHNVTADNNAFKSNDLSNGGKFTFTFTKAGTYSYICSIHPRMKATVVVQ